MCNFAFPNKKKTSLTPVADMDTTKIQEVKMRYNVVGDSDGLNRALDVALQVAPTDLSVLIIGESGVGKEVIPRIIHDHSPRKRETYFAINCGSIPQGTIDSELFGHEKGAFTGAIGESAGYFGTADKGTLFLDEVGELPLATQARLLRVLEKGEYIRVGGQEVRKTNVRIVAATNVNMQKAISEGRFREDLYYRLSTIPLKMPPLRERGNDILLLFRLFAMNMAQKYSLPRLSLTEEAKQIMLRFKWPGNVRQLKNVTEQMSILAKDSTIDRETLLQFISDDPESTALQIVGHGPNTGGGTHSFENEREFLYKILYDLKATVNSLHQEINDLRKRIDDRNTITTALDNHLTSLAPIPTESKVSVEEPIHPHSIMEDAVAEEITTSEENTLNIGSMQRHMLEKALERSDGNRKLAAQHLGISERTLYRRLKEYGMQ